MAGRVAVVIVLGITQTIAWASSYYMPAILGAPIATALHLPTSMFFGLFSAALLLSAVIGPSVGRLIDRHGGRVLLAGSNLVIATGLVILASAHGIIGLVIAWTVLGVGIGMGRTCGCRFGMSAHLLAGLRTNYARWQRNRCRRTMNRLASAQVTSRRCVFFFSPR
jgi:MFS family permease